MSNFEGSACIKNISDNKGTKYVEEIKTPITYEGTKGLGFFEGGANSSWTSGGSYSISKYTNFAYTNTGWVSDGSYIFRPAIWNIDR